MLHRKSTRRALSVGVAVLAVIGPVSEPVAPAEPAAQLAPAAPPPAEPAPTGPAPNGPGAWPAGPATGIAGGGGSLLADALALRRAYRPAGRSVGRPATHRPAQATVVARTGPAHVRPVVRRLAAPPVSAIRIAAMRRVVWFARAQVGKPYRSGGIGLRAFDCSGFTMRAYRLVGVRLPHSSGGQAARGRTIPWSHALAGDLVVGPGHVGIYMGRGMMIDAGTSRTGVVYRRVYRGLRVERV